MCPQSSKEFYPYHDEELSMHVPRYLRPKKGMRYFAQKHKCDRAQPILNMAIELPNDELTVATLSTIANATSSEFSGVEQRIVRRGKAPFVSEGIELLSSIGNAATREVQYNYHILFKIASRTVYMVFFGHGPLDVFERACQSVISTIKLNDTR